MGQTMMCPAAKVTRLRADVPQFHVGLQLCHVPNKSRDGAIIFEDPARYPETAAIPFSPPTSALLPPITRSSTMKPARRSVDVRSSTAMPPSFGRRRSKSLGVPLTDVGPGEASSTLERFLSAAVQCNTALGDQEIPDEHKLDGCQDGSTQRLTTNLPVSRSVPHSLHRVIRAPPISHSHHQSLDFVPTRLSSSEQDGVSSFVSAASGISSGHPSHDRDSPRSRSTSCLTGSSPLEELAERLQRLAETPSIRQRSQSRRRSGARSRSKDLLSGDLFYDRPAPSTVPSSRSTYLDLHGSVSRATLRPDRREGERLPRAGS